MFALSKTILVTGLWAALAVALSACGQRGNLYLPPPKAPATPAAAAAVPASPSPAASARQP